MSGAPPPSQRQVTLRDGRAVVLRRAIPDDAQAVLDYIRRVLPDQDAYVPLTVPEFDYTLEQERAMLAETERAIFIIALHDDEIVGHAFAKGSPRKRVRHVIELGIGSPAAYHGSGIGSAMMDMLVAWACANPLIEQLTLKVYADNARAIALYRKFGFVTCGHVPRMVKYEDGTYRDDLIMVRDCREVCDGAA